jgi:uncharacterized protein involved in exopolysaccharide biosynthesis
MTQITKESSELNASGIIIFLYLWKKPILLVTVVAAIASGIFSGPQFIKPKFESSVVFFPGSTSSISKAVLNESAGIKNDVLEFGDEEEAEHLLQILNSDEIRYNIIQKYNLMGHYDIDEEDDYPITKLNKEYDNNISFRRTEYMSIEIKVLDTDPDTAALIANDIASLLDSAKNRMQKTIAIKAFAIVESEYNDLIDHIKGIKDSLGTLGELGVHDYKSQSEVLNRAYAQALARNETRAISTLEERLKILAKYGSTQMALSLKLETIYEEVFPVMMRKYKEAKIDATENLPHKFIVNNAYAAEKKSYPIRWLIVVVSSFSAFLLCVVAIILSDNIRRIKKAL